MPINVRERDQIWNCPTNPVASGDDPVAAIPSPATGVNVPAPFPGVVTKFLEKGTPNEPGQPPPVDPESPPIKPPPEPPVYPEPPPEFLDGYWEVWHTYTVGDASDTLDGGHNWYPASTWNQMEVIEQTLVFRDSFDTAPPGTSLFDHVPDFGAGLTTTWT